MTEKTTISGVLNIDKPAGLTSHDVVVKVRKLLATSYQLRAIKVGHTGTLDPFATGVLLIAVGPATRLIQFSHAWDKEYEATFVLGATSDTDDITGRITNDQIPMTTQIPMTKIEENLKTFVGEIEQRPPAYSAVKIKGKKLYEYARENKKVGLPAELAGEIRPRKVTIHEIELREYQYPEIIVRIRCGTGTYIRSLARDVGEALGTGAYVSSLRRTRIGSFDIRTSVSLDKLSTAFPQSFLSPSTLVSHLPPVALTSHNVGDIRQGKGITVSPIPKNGAGPMALFDERSSLIGVAAWDPTTSLLSPTINL